MLLWRSEEAAAEAKKAGSIGDAAHRIPRIIFIIMFSVRQHKAGDLKWHIKNFINNLGGSHVLFYKCLKPTLNYNFVWITVNRWNKY